MKDMYRIGHNGTFVSGDYLREVQAESVRSQQGRDKKVLGLGCTGLIVGGLSVVVIGAGLMELAVGHVTGDAEAINTGRVTLGVGFGGLAFSGGSFLGAYSISRRP